MDIVIELVSGTTQYVGDTDTVRIQHIPPSPKELRAAREILRLRAVVQGLTAHIQSFEPYLEITPQNQSTVLDVECKVILN